MIRTDNSHRDGFNLSWFRGGGLTIIMIVASTFILVTSLLGSIRGR